MSETSAGISFEPPSLLESQESAWAPIPNLVFWGGWELGISVTFAVLARVENHTLMLQVISPLVSEEVSITSDYGILTLQLQWCSRHLLRDSHNLCGSQAIIAAQLRSWLCPTSLVYLWLPWVLLGLSSLLHTCSVCSSTLILVTVLWKQAIEYPLWWSQAELHTLVIPRTWWVEA